METLKTRCPSCSKLYAVDRQDISTARPQFECIDCHARFAFNRPELVDETSSTQEVDSYLIPWQSMPEFVEGRSHPVEKTGTASQASKTNSQRQISSPVGEGEPCSKCGFRNGLGVSECLRCGVVLSKTKQNFRVSSRLQSFWEEILAHYEEEDLHHDFIRACQRDNSLPFAAAKYQNILAADPSEEIAEKMRRQVMILAQAPMVAGSGLKMSAEDQNLLRKMSGPLLAVVVLIVLSVVTPGLDLVRWLGAVTCGVALVFFLRHIGLWPRS